jgi:hypothetical protein
MRDLRQQSERGRVGAASRVAFDVGAVPVMSGLQGGQGWPGGCIGRKIGVGRKPEVLFSLAQAFTPGGRMRQEMTLAPSGIFSRKPLKGLKKPMAAPTSQA